MGPFRAVESISQCQDCGTIHTSKQLQELVPDCSNYGYDVIVFIGQAVLVRHQNIHQVKKELQQRDITISESSITDQLRKYITYVALAHQRCSSPLKQLFSTHGGYVLHIDATCDKGPPHLLSGMDSISKIVLGNVKITSENSGEIIPFLQDIKKKYGVPLATVHDMGKGICKAVETVFPDIYDLICHYHFIADIGKDLYGCEYDIIRNRLKKHGISGELKKQRRVLNCIIEKDPRLIKDIDKPSSFFHPCVSALTLIEWALDGMNQGNGYGFPFDRPHWHFAQRIRQLYQQLDQINPQHIAATQKERKAVMLLMRKVKCVYEDYQLKQAIEEIVDRFEVFERLRGAMAVAEPSCSKGLYCARNIPLRSIEKRVKYFRVTLIEEHGPCLPGHYQQLLQQLDKYWQKLFADPIEVQTPKGKRFIQPQRTNNIMEQFFRQQHRSHRRRTGNSSMGKMLQTMLVDTPLVRNIQNPQYRKILLDGHNSLEELFASIQADEVRKKLQREGASWEKIPKVIKKLISTTDLPDLISKIMPQIAAAKAI